MDDAEIECLCLLGCAEIVSRFSGVGDVDGFAPRVPSEVKAESAVKTYGVATTDQAQDFRRGADRRGHVSDLELVADSGSGAGALDPGKGEGHGESPVVSHPSSLSSLQDRRKQQLRLINEKLAKRHSMLHRKDLSCRQDKQSETPAIMSAVRGDSEVPPAPSVVVKSSKDGPLVSKTALMQPTLSREVPGKSVAYKPTTYSNISYPMSVGEGINHHLTQTESFTLRDPLPTSTKGDLLESESSFLPVSLLRDSSVSPDLSGHEDSTVHHPEDTDMYINSLLSSLNSAYGYSSLSDKSRLLSTLVGSERLQLRDTLDAPSPEQPDFHGEAVKIQAAYRGHIARKEYRRQLREQKAALLIQATWYVMLALFSVGSRERGRWLSTSKHSCTLRRSILGIFYIENIRIKRGLEAIFFQRESAHTHSFDRDIVVAFLCQPI